MDKKIPVFPAVMALSALFCFAAAYFVVTSCFLKPEYEKGLLYAIPFAVLLIITLCAYFKKLSGKTACILTCIVSVLSVIGAFFLSAYFMFTSNTLTAKDLPYYERVLARTSLGESCAGLLPEQIPENAEDVFFYYTPQILQGGEIFALAFTADDAALDAYEAKLVKNALWTGTYKQAKDAGWNVLCPYALRGRYQSAILPDAYKIFALGASTESGQNANHTLLYTVTLNRETNEIVFDYRRW